MLQFCFSDVGTCMSRSERLLGIKLGSSWPPVREQEPQISNSMQLPTAKEVEAWIFPWGIQEEHIPTDTFIWSVGPQN